MFTRNRRSLSGLLVLAVLAVSLIIVLGLWGTSASLGFGKAQTRTQPVLAAARPPLTGANTYPVAGGYDPWSMAFDRAGRVWLALPDCDPAPRCAANAPAGTLAVFDPASASWTASYHLPEGYGQPLFLAVAPDGRLWFPLPMSNSLGSFDPATQTFARWPVPTANAGPWALAIDQHGLIWFTEHYSNKLGRFDPVTQRFLEIATPAVNSQPYGIAVDAANTVWFTENNAAVALIGAYTSRGQLREYRVRDGSTANLTPHLLTIDAHGDVWWSEGWVGALGVLRVAQAVPGTARGVHEYRYSQSCTQCGSHTSGIAVDHQGKIWFDDSLQGVYGSFPSDGRGTFQLYSTPTINGHPHDGLAIDGRDRLWLSEEFANTLSCFGQ